MKIFVIVLIVTAAWVVVAAILSGCKARMAAASSDGSRCPAGGEFWSWAQRESGVRLRGDEALPPTHPLSRIADVRAGSERGR